MGASVTINATPEIFNAEALVVQNKDCVKDRDFSAVSVTAEQWLPMWEVPVGSLKQFLAAQKLRGYTIVDWGVTLRMVSVYSLLGNGCIL